MKLSPELNEEFPGVCRHCGGLAVTGSRCESYPGLIHNGEPPYRTKWSDNVADLVVLGSFVVGCAAAAWLMLLFVLNAVR